MQMFISLFCRNSALGSAVDKTDLNKIRFIDIGNIVDRFTNGRSNSIEAGWFSVVTKNETFQNLSVCLIKA